MTQSFTKFVIYLPTDGGTEEITSWLNEYHHDPSNSTLADFHLRVLPFDDGIVLCPSDEEMVEPEEVVEVVQDILRQFDLPPIICRFVYVANKPIPDEFGSASAIVKQDVILWHTDQDWVEKNL